MVRFGPSSSFSVLDTRAGRKPHAIASGGTAGFQYAPNVSGDVCNKPPFLPCRVPPRSVVAAIVGGPEAAGCSDSDSAADHDRDHLINYMFKIKHLWFMWQRRLLQLRCRTTQTCLFRQSAQRTTPTGIGRFGAKLNGSARRGVADPRHKKALALPGARIRRATAAGDVRSGHSPRRRGNARPAPAGACRRFSSVMPERLRSAPDFHCRVCRAGPGRGLPLVVE